MNNSETSMIEGVLWVPRRIEINEKSLLASFSAGARRKTISPTMLAEFAEIGVTGQKSRLIRFARRYGPIGICEHGVPCGHNRQSFARLSNVMDCQPTPASVRGWDQGEPLEKWFEFAKQAQAILACSASLHCGERPKLEDLKTAYPTGPARMPRKKSEFFPTALGLVTGAINTWIHYGGLRPHLRWNRAGCSVVFSAGDYCSVFGALAVQLMLAAANQEKFVICSGCGISFVPKRRPNPRRRTFCRRCGLPAAWRLSKQDTRNRVRIETSGAAGRLD